MRAPLMSLVNTSVECLTLCGLLKIIVTSQHNLLSSHIEEKSHKNCIKIKITRFVPSVHVCLLLFKPGNLFLQTFGLHEMVVFLRVLLSWIWCLVTAPLSKDWITLPNLSHPLWGRDNSQKAPIWSVPFPRLDACDILSHRDKMQLTRKTAKFWRSSAPLPAAEHPPLLLPGAPWCSLVQTQLSPLCRSPVVSIARHNPHCK